MKSNPVENPVENEAGKIHPGEKRPGRGLSGEILLELGEFLLFFYRSGFPWFHPGEFWDPQRGTEAGV